MRRSAALMLALLATGVSAQVVNGPAPDVQQPPPQERPSGGGGGLGLGLSISLGGKKKPKPPPAPLWEKGDALIDEQVPGQLVVVITGYAADAARIARASRVTLIDFTLLESIDKGMAVITLAPADSADAATTRLSKQRGVEWVQPNFQFQTLAGKLPRRFSLMGISSPSQLRASGTVAMIDTPVDNSRPELRGASITQTVYGTSSAPAAHGTAIASLIVGTGEVQGMAQGARLISLAAFDPHAAASGISQTRYLAKAMDAAWKLRPDVLNLSFGGREDRLLSSLLTVIGARGICMAGAVGNGGPQSAVQFPARHPAVLAVTASDDRLRIYARAARGPEVAVTGVGVGLLASVPRGYRTVSGTSFAAATVSGALMHLPQCTSAHDPAAMRAAVTALAQDLSDKGHDPVFGAGLMRLSVKK